MVNLGKRIIDATPIQEFNINLLTIMMDITFKQLTHTESTHNEIKSLDIMTILYINLNNNKVTRMNIVLYEGMKDNEYVFKLLKNCSHVGWHFWAMESVYK